MLIPIELLTQFRKDQFESLKTFSIKITKNTYKFIIEYQKTTENSYLQIKHPMLSFVNQMGSYADGIEGYFNLDDKNWYDKSFGGFNLFQNFNDQQNFEILMKMTEHKNNPIKIIQGFLILENGCNN